MLVFFTEWLWLWWLYTGVYVLYRLLSWLKLVLISVSILVYFPFNRAKCFCSTFFVPKYFILVKDEDSFSIFILVSAFNWCAFDHLSFKFFYLPVLSDFVRKCLPFFPQMWIFDTSDGDPRLLRFRSGHSAPPLCIK